MKKLIAIFLCLIMLLSFAACGVAGNPADNASINNGQTENIGQTDNNTSSDNEKTSAGITAPDNTDDAVKSLEKQFAALKTDDIKWEYNSSTKTVVISGKGPMRDYLENAPEWNKYCDEAEHVVICDEVTSVGAGAFLLFSAITDVDLGNTVEFIGESAFNNCCDLQTINFPEALKYIGKEAFNNDLLHSENGFVFPEGMLYLGDSSFRSAFKDSYVSIPASLSNIETGAFANCFVEEFRVDPANQSYSSDNGILYDKNMTSVINYPADKRDKIYEIPESVTTILAEAIVATNTLEKIVIPAGVSGIEEGAIFWNYALASIDVNENNKSYQSKDGVLYTADCKLLLSYPIASDRTEYTILEGCERICDYAISQANNLSELHSNEGLKEIGYCSIYLCSNLVKSSLPKSLKTIGTNAFKYCDALTEIDFAGNSSEWNNVEIKEKNELLTDGSVRIYCAE